MFEAESEIWAKENMDCVKTVSFLNHDCNYYSDEERCVAKSAFQAGATLAYSKATEWHYPSKGEYPKDEFIDEYKKSRLPSEHKRHYCLYLGDNDCVMGKYIKGLFWTVEGRYSLSDIIAWKEIVLPEEIKEND